MLQTKYITVDDFKEYTGIDLNYELKDDDNSSNKALSFLNRIETRMSAFLDAEFYRNVDLEFPKFTDYQKEHYKLALLEQALYVFKNGDISVDSGYDVNEGEKASNLTIKSKIISHNSKQQLLLCGLWCRKIKGYQGNFWGLL